MAESNGEVEVQVSLPVAWESELEAELQAELSAAGGDPADIAELDQSDDARFEPIGILLWVGTILVEAAVGYLVGRVLERFFRRKAADSPTPVSMTVMLPDGVVVVLNSSDPAALERAFEQLRGGFTGT
ncbi:hypothetical protein [Microbacterium sp. SS28]|uniref:hypothetical protein n=1 Tax=Microbacterium sp. SS28 TaxID=2919948 RepID=UPI001FA9971C|nr:hypothetical protein [Microbacterium sp. SS28]